MPGFMPKNRFQVFSKDSKGNFTPLGSFRNISGLSVETEQTSWKTGDMLSELKVPGETKFGHITLKKGVDSNDNLSKWRNNIFSKDCSSDTDGTDFRDTYIFIIDRACKIQRVIFVDHAWPSKYELDELDSMSSDALIESVELANSGWYYVAQGDSAHGADYLGLTAAAQPTGLWTLPLLPGASTGASPDNG